MTLWELPDMQPLLLAVSAPRDVPLSLPSDGVALRAWLVPLFLLHILFVNLMVGSTVLASVYECVGLRRPRYDDLARHIAATVTVNKSIAVVLGVGPLLVIGLVYTTQWYGANILTGHAWLMVVPLVATVFLLTYLHRYTWASWSRGGRKIAHVIVGLVNVGLFLLIPLIFLANVNLMHFPTRWVEAEGLVGSLLLGNGNALARYFHFLVACIAVTALFLAGWLTWSRRGRESLPAGFTGPELMRQFYLIALFATAAQFAIGPVLLLLLPRVGINSTLLLLIVAGVGLAGLMMYLLLSEIASSDAGIGRRWLGVVVLLGGVAIVMGTLRQTYRDAALLGPQREIEQQTTAFVELSEAVRARYSTGGAGELSVADQFEVYCGSCHRMDDATAAPTIGEIARLYEGQPGAIAEWAKNPGKKRAAYPKMPSFDHVSDGKLLEIGRHMLGLVGGEQGQSSAGAEPDRGG